MYSKHRKYSKSSNKFNKETRILIISCIIESVYPINATITFSHVIYVHYFDSTNIYIHYLQPQHRTLVWVLLRPTRTRY